MKEDKVILFFGIQKKGFQETEQIIRTVKELLIKNVGKPKKLSKLIDKYLIPQGKIIRKYPKIFEPCAGKVR